MPEPIPEVPKCPICFNDLEGVSGLYGDTGAQYSDDPIRTPHHFLPECRGYSPIRSRHITEVQAVINEYEVGPRSGISGYSGESDYFGVSGATQWSDCEIVRAKNINECREAIEKAIGYSGYGWVTGESGASSYEPIPGYSGTELRDFLSQDKDGNLVEPYYEMWLGGIRIGQKIDTERLPGKDEIGYDPFHKPETWTRREIIRGMHIEEIRKKLPWMLLEEFKVTTPEVYVDEAYVQDGESASSPIESFPFFTPLPMHDTLAKNWRCTWRVMGASSSADPTEGHGPTNNPYDYPSGTYNRYIYREDTNPGPYILRTHKVRFPCTMYQYMNFDYDLEHHGGYYNIRPFDPPQWYAECQLPGVPQWGANSPYRIMQAQNLEFPEEPLNWLTKGGYDLYSESYRAGWIHDTTFNGNYVSLIRGGTLGYRSSPNPGNPALGYPPLPAGWYLTFNSYKTHIVQQGGYWVNAPILDGEGHLQWLFPTYLDLIYEYKIVTIPHEFSVGGHCKIQVEERDIEEEGETLTIHNFNMKTLSTATARGWLGASTSAFSDVYLIFEQIDGRYDWIINSKLKMTININSIFTPPDNTSEISLYPYFWFYLGFYSVTRGDYREIGIFYSPKDVPPLTEYWRQAGGSGPSPNFPLPDHDPAKDWELDIGAMYKDCFPDDMAKDEELIFLTMEAFFSADDSKSSEDGYAYSSLSTTYDCKISRIKFKPVRRKPGTVLHPTQGEILPG